MLAKRDEQNATRSAGNSKRVPRKHGELFLCRVLTPAIATDAPVALFCRCCHSFVVMPSKDTSSGSLNLLALDESAASFLEGPFPARLGDREKLDNASIGFFFVRKNRQTGTHRAPGNFDHLFIGTLIGLNNSKQTIRSVTMFVNSTSEKEMSCK